MAKITGTETDLNVATMVLGMSDKTKQFQAVRIEADHFRHYDLSSFHNLVAVHATLHPNAESLKDLERDKNIPLRKKIARQQLIARMCTVEETLEQMEALDRDLALVIHTESACYLLDQLIKDKVQVGKRIRVYLENEDFDAGKGLYVKGFEATYKASLDPYHPRTPRIIADRLQDTLKRKVGNVLDIDHLLATHPEISIEEAAHFMGGPTYGHVSGPDHKDLDGGVMINFAKRVPTLEQITMEGPTPGVIATMTGRITSDHIRKVDKTYHQATGQHFTS